MIILGRIWAAIGSYVTALLIGAGAVFAVIVGHKRAVSQAETRGKTEERREAEQQATKRKTEVSEAIEAKREEVKEQQADRREREVKSDPRDQLDNHW